jgi:hypothetical protein
MTDPERPWTDKEVDELVRKGKEVCLHEYPNPGGVGCPSDEVLERLATRGSQTAITDELVSHVVTCSPCFTKYTEYRQQLRQRTRKRYAVLSTAAVLVLVFAVLVVRNLTLEPGRSSLSSNEGRPQPALESKEESPAKERAEPGAPSLSKSQDAGAEQRSDEWTQASFDMRDSSGSRGEGESSSRQTILPRARVDLRILLPVGSPSGAYDVALDDAAGRRVIAQGAQAILQNGLTVAHTKLDLSLAPDGSLRFGVRRPGGDWAWGRVRVR